MCDADLPISALQHYAYCPRQFALIHIEQVWEENRFTAQGRALHERVDSGVSEQRGAMRAERGVLLRSTVHGLVGIADLLEINQTVPAQVYLVEYKRGKPKVEDWDRVQLCAQAICLEEMRGIHIEAGALWYWKTRKRVQVVFDVRLRNATFAIIGDAKALLAQGRTPSPIDDAKRCRGCSLINLCEPDKFRRDGSAQYIASLFQS